MSDKAVSKGSKEKDEIDYGLLNDFLLLRTVVPAICNMGERVWPTVQALREVAKTEAEREGS